ncbi:MAG: sigma-54-dependent Fis family transcriptional regulator [Desulfobacterales bacterium]|nr:sigma-54-dependent Fis family transcriptional regulator [Desulfobacterales bacterium]
MLKKELLIYFADDNDFYLDSLKLAYDNSITDYNGVNYNVKIKTFNSIEEFSKVKGENPDVILLDIVFYDDYEAGYKLLKSARKKYPEKVIIMYSGHDNGETIAKYIAAGASNFISKQTSLKKLISNLINYYILYNKDDNNKINGNIDSNISGNTLKTIAERVPKILKSPIKSVYVYGKTGTGKEVVSNIFEQNLNNKSPFIRVNCAAISKTVMLSELFGHKKGAFTGAQSDKIGLIEAAENGWIFLDEIDCLSEDAQSSLLRAIESGEIRSVGSNETKNIKFRILSASNKNLSELVKEKKFRKDLWQRLCITTIFIPPLSERKDEISIIANHIAKKLPEGPYEITPATMNVFESYSWSEGNCRELYNCLLSMTEEAYVSKVFEPSFIPERIYIKINNDTSSSTIVPSIVPEIDISNYLYSEIEENLFINTVKKVVYNNNIKSKRGVAKKIGMSKSTFTRRVDKLISNNKLENIFE